MATPDWPPTETIETARLVLEPLRVDHAEEMASVLDDAKLHGFIGGHPATLEELRDRYTRQVVGVSRDGTQGWFNWVVRHRGEGSAVGTVQATLLRQRADGLTSAEIAWVIAVPHQGEGYAREAAAGMVGWLLSHGVDNLVAHVHPDHHASMGVARHVGLAPTDTTIDGETRWSS